MKWLLAPCLADACRPVLVSDIQALTRVAVLNHQRCVHPRCLDDASKKSRVTRPKPALTGPPASQVHHEPEGPRLESLRFSADVQFRPPRALELRRDAIRGTLAMLGSVILMFVMGYGISLDAEDITFAVIDRDQDHDLPRLRG